MIIADQVAVRASDKAQCTGATDTVLRGSATVLIEGKPAARWGDPTIVGIITSGEPTVLIGGPESRPDLAQIQLDYQVQDDEVIDWSPHILGIPVDLLGERRVTKTEGKMLDRLIWDEGMLGLKRFKDIADGALATASARYPDPTTVPTTVPTDRKSEWLGNDGHRDAFRHAYWNALTTSENGEEWAREFTTAHEGLPENPAVREAMDLYNNEVGRLIARHAAGASADQLADLIQKAIKRGDLLVVDRNGNLAWSDQVPLWEHGLAPATPGFGGLPVPAGNASAE